MAAVLPFNFLGTQLCPDSTTMLHGDLMQITDQNRTIFEAAGFGALKLEIAYSGTRFNLAVPGVADQAKAWLVETEGRMRQERQDALYLDRRRHNIMRCWTVIAVIGGIMAAATGIIALLR